MTADPKDLAPEAAGGGAAPAEPATGGVTGAELAALQAAEEAKGDPALDDVPSAEIDVPAEKEEPFEKLQAAARRLSEARARTVIETLLLTRFALLLLGANATQGLVAFVYGITDPLVRPFQGIFGQPEGPPMVDVAAILAVLFFLLVGALVVAGVRAATGRRAGPRPTG